MVLQRRTAGLPGAGAGATRLGAMTDAEQAERLCGVAQRVRNLSLEQWGDPCVVNIVGKAPDFVELLGRAAKVARFNEPVLVTGESGVGKEYLARAIYLLGQRRGRPYVTVNCPQYRDGNLTVSELFGHKRGSFTGATADRKGCFETANGGVIFLDEIGDLHMSAQVMLLRALAEGEFQPLGADQRRQVNVRVVAATNRPVENLMVRTEFRNDLFFRLRYFLLSILPLRERGDDWRLLLDHFLDRLHRQYGVRKTFSAGSLRILESYDWPGNVRELNSVATMGYAMSETDVIEPDDFVSLLTDHAPPVGGTDESLFRRMEVSGESFWKVLHQPFMDRDLNREQMKAFIRKGLVAAGGSYRRLLSLFNLDEEDYQKFMDFLRHHRLKP